jgi:hypothetical protein
MSPSRGVTFGGVGACLLLLRTFLLLLRRRIPSQGLNGAAHLDTPHLMDAVVAAVPPPACTPVAPLASVAAAASAPFPTVDAVAKGVRLQDAMLPTMVWVPPVTLSP